MPRRKKPVIKLYEWRVTLSRSTGKVDRFRIIAETAKAAIKIAEQLGEPELLDPIIETEAVRLYDDRASLQHRAN